ncbi:hypothetical protein E2542_SST22940 [Spatholobus suberectus]|nr:hypothetical protein E2542_SST22940 [Spatholobus suberectus]
MQMWLIVLCFIILCFFVALLLLFLYLVALNGNFMEGRRRAGVHNAFNNGQDGEQNISGARITAGDGGLTDAFNNERNGNQNLAHADINLSGDRDTVAWGVPCQPLKQD